MEGDHTGGPDPSPRPGDRVAGYLGRHGRATVIVLLVSTVALVWPMLTMAPDTVASQTPDTEVTRAQGLIDARFEPSEHEIMFVVEAGAGDILERSALADLHQAISSVRADERLAEFLVEVGTPDPDVAAVGTYTLADAVDAALRQSGESGGLAVADPGTVEAAIAAILDETGPGVWGLAEQAASDPAGTWHSPAMFVGFAADNEALGGGGTVITVGTGDARREQYARDLQSGLRQNAAAFSTWAIAADVNLTAEDQGLLAGPFIAATVAAVLLVLGIVFRSYWPVAVAGAAFGALMVWIKGGANLLGFREDQILATILPIAMVSFGIDSTFHALGRMREVPHEGSSRRTFVIGFGAVAGALALAAATDSAAFLANTTSGIESVRQFGLAAALATIAAFALLGLGTPLAIGLIEDRTGAATLTKTARGDVLPAAGAAAGATAVVMVLVFLSPSVGAAMWVWYLLAAIALPLVRRRPEAISTVGVTHHGKGNVTLGVMVRWVASRPKTVLTTALVITGLAGWSASSLDTNFDVKEFFSSDSDFIVGIDTAQEYLGDQAGEVTSVYIEGDFAQPEAIGLIHDFIDAVDIADPGALARREDGSLAVAPGILDLVDGAAADGVDGLDTTDGIRRLFDRLLTEGMDAAWTPGRVADVLWASPDRAVYATALGFQIVDTRRQDDVHAVREVLDPLVEDLEQALRVRDGAATATLTGSPIVRDDQLAAIVRSLLLTLPVAAVACLILAASFMRSIRHGLMAIVPIGFVVVWLFGYMAATGRSINVVTAIVGAVSIGIGIDYATHFTMRFLEEHRRTGDNLAAIEAAGSGTGAALAGSAATSVAGFGILAFAPMPLFASYGALTAVMIVMALVAALFVLPSLLSLTPRAKAAETSPRPERDETTTEPVPNGRRHGVGEMFGGAAVPPAVRVGRESDPLPLPAAGPAFEAAVTHDTCAAQVQGVIDSLYDDGDEPVGEDGATQADPADHETNQTPRLVLDIAPDGSWVDVRIPEAGTVYRGRGDATRRGIVEAMVAALAARAAVPVPVVIDVFKHDVRGHPIMVVMLGHAHGRLGAGVAPLGHSIAHALEEAVIDAMHLHPSHGARA
jgi:hypothetical protein